jgi:hypothetical protein
MVTPFYSRGRHWRRHLSFENICHTVSLTLILSHAEGTRGERHAAL